MEGFDDQFLLLTYVIDDLLFEDEKAGINAKITVVNRMNVVHQAAIPLGNGYRMITQIRTDAQEAGNLVLLMKVVDLLLEPQVAEAVAIVREKFLFAFKVLLHGLQPHADIGADSSIGKSNSPIMNVAVDEL